MNHQALPRYVVIGCLITALFFVVIGYDRNLPIPEYDEAILLSQTIRSRGLIDFNVLTLPGYPPVILTLFTGTQLLTEALLHESVLNHAGLVIRIVRILALLANATTVYVIMRMGRKLGYPLVGLVSAVIWSVLPLVNTQAALALTEPFQIVFISLSAWLMLKTLDSRQMVWGLLCTLCGLFAILSKYNAFPVLGFGVGASLFLLLVDARKRYWGFVLFLQSLMIGITAYLLWFVYGASELLATGHVETTQFTHGGWNKLFDLQSITYVFSAADSQVGLPHLSLLIAILAFGLVLMFRKSGRATRVAIVYLLIFAVSSIWLVSTYIVWGVLKYRYTSPASSILVLLICFFVWHLVTLLAHRAKRPGAVPSVFLLTCLIWTAPSISTRLQDFRELQFQETGQAFIQWSAQSLEANATLAINGLDDDATLRWRYFNPIFGGYTGPSRPLVDILLYLQKPKSAWIDAGIDYVHMTGNYPGDYPTLPFGLDEMLLLKTFPNSADSPHWRGDVWYIYRLQTYQTESDVRFANTIRLRGYDLSSETVSPGDQIAIRTYWQASQPPATDYHLYVHLSSMDVHDALAQVDGPPSLLTRMTSTWTDPEETIVGEEYHLTIPTDLPAGTYRLLVGLYDLGTGQRLDADNGQQYFELATITVSD